MTPIIFLNQRVADELYQTVGNNLDRYRQGDFRDLALNETWNMTLRVRADYDRLSELRNTSEPSAEIHNSIVVGETFGSLTPTLAREDRLWTRLSHVECLEYSRSRWPLAGNNNHLENYIKKHFFARTLSGCRDDHAISRLWWNYHISKLAIPDDPRRALGSLLALADIRQAVVERARMGARQVLLREIVVMLDDPKTGFKNNIEVFREFMKIINLRGAGKIFEVMPEKKVKSFMSQCLDIAWKNCT